MAGLNNRVSSLVFYLSKSVYKIRQHQSDFWNLQNSDQVMLNYMNFIERMWTFFVYIERQIKTKQKTRYHFLFFYQSTEQWAHPDLKIFFGRWRQWESVTPRCQCDKIILSEIESIFTLHTLNLASLDSNSSRNIIFTNLFNLSRVKLAGCFKFI